MDPDLLLILGACLVAGIIGLEAGLKMAENKIPNNLNEMAEALARVHESHTDTKAKIVDHTSKVRELIERITKEYLILEKK